jgi:GT2 family glycosyltransferase
MKLSVIIVNYNVRFFLEQCLLSVLGATGGIEAEVFVVDNNSVDGSTAMVREKFPTVNLIENGENLGFSIANNIAIRKAAGEYVLLLNPDTVVEEDTFVKSLAYMDAHPDCGVVGVKMIDGKGNFLPESKRGLPTPWVAFHKMFGLSKLFPQSRMFGRYNLSYLDADKIHDVDVLCGAFMLIRKRALDSAGLLDENFFMYGEDIDLSYRIQQAGFRVVYFPYTTIIHYKGESTRKGSLNYVYLFYKAMQTFVRKHFSGQGAWWFHVAINTAIYIRAALSVVKRVLLALLLPFLDVLLISAGVVLLSRLWGQLWFHNANY